VNNPMEARDEALVASNPVKNWRVVIEEARARGSFTEEERDRANEWFSCACGQLHPAIQRHHVTSLDGDEGEPCDAPLSSLGYDFAYKVRLNQFSDALMTLNAIEAREAELLAELGVK
jgi:hypothetical protein